jgi:cysteinyl-tRNA synthetase
MLRIFNSLSKTVEEFTSIDPYGVRIYTCGPTVYSFATIGNFRTYTSVDFIIRALKINGYDVSYLMNITDVGHLTGDNDGDADMGVDRMERSATKEGRSAWEVAEFYTEAFKTEFSELNLTPPERFAKATDYIAEQIALVQKLEKRGYTYQTSDGIYFDTSRFSTYGELSSLDQIREGARVEINPEKRNPRDFALWKFSPTNEKRQMEWKSPWGKGFPGWHIECSAMSMKYLGESFDIHTGGMDLKETHHPNEIAQSEAATGKKFVNYWMHVTFLLVNGEKMSKSKNNVYRVYDLVKEGYEPLALRYLYLQTHYRQEMNFTFGGLDGAQNALTNLRKEMLKLKDAQGRSDFFYDRFLEAMNDDINTPQALAIMWEMMNSHEDNGKKLATLFLMDELFGFNLQEYYEEQRNRPAEKIPSEVHELVAERERLRKAKHFSAADHYRNKIKKLGYDIKDTDTGTKISRIEEE